MVEPLDASVLDKESTKKLTGTQDLCFKAVTELVTEYLDEDSVIPIQIAYDVILDQLPPPVGAQRDRRPETMRRAMATLHEKGYITISGETLTIGSVINESAESKESPLSEM